MESKKRKREDTICNATEVRMLKELGISNPKGESISKTETTALLAKRLKKILKQKGTPAINQFLYDYIRHEIHTGDSIPPEVWLNIFLRLDDIRDLQNCKLVSKGWLSVLGESFWKIFAKEHWELQVNQEEYPELGNNAFERYCVTRKRHELQMAALPDRHRFLHHRPNVLVLSSVRDREDDHQEGHSDQTITWTTTGVIYSLKNSLDYIHVEFTANVQAVYVYVEYAVQELTTELSFSITKDNSGRLSDGPIQMLEDKTWVVRTSDPAISEIQSRLGYGDDTYTWEFVSALFEITFVHPDYARTGDIYVPTDDIYSWITE